MRENFKFFIEYSEDKLIEIWEECIFVFDTNVLLDLYRYSTATREVLISLMESLKKRIWLPHQIGMEFYKNKTSVIIEQMETFGEIKNILKEHSSKLNSELNEKLKKYNKKKHSAIDISSISKRLSKELEEILKDLDEKEKQHPNLFKEDNIVQKLEELFNGKVGRPYSQEKLDKIYQEGESRYKDNIPPGYKDEADKKSKTFFENITILDKFGDLILWKQIIDMAKEEQKHVIFVTGDIKEDWFRAVRGKTQGPRLELLYEFNKETGTSFYMYQTERFMEYAQGYLKQKVDSEAILEIQKLRALEEERRNEDIIGPDLSFKEEFELRKKLKLIDKNYPIFRATSRQDFEVGDRVYHLKFGIGRVLATNDSGDNQEIEVLFKVPIGPRILLAKSAPIEKIMKE